MDSKSPIFAAEPDAATLRVGLSQVVAAQAFGIALADLRAPGRGDRGAALARQVAMYLSHVVFAMPAAVVARAFGRERSTASHAVRRIEALRDDPALDRTLCRLEGMLRSATEAVR